MKTIAGTFDSMVQAELVFHELENLGIPREGISILAGNDAQRRDEYLAKAKEAQTGAGAAAASAASFGGGIGLVASLVALAIPGVGPFITGGAITTLLAGLGVGAVGGGLIGAFRNMGIDREQAPLYEEAVKRGAVMVTAHVSDPLENEAVAVMDRHGAHDLENAADTWKAAGWEGPNPHPYALDDSYHAHEPSEPASRETAPRPTRARVYDYQPMEENSAGSTRAAQPVAGTQAQTGTQQTGASNSEFQFPTASKPIHVSSSDPAYVFGNRWASDPNYAGRSWTDVESDLRNNWNALGSGPWDTFKDNIRQGYEGGEDPAKRRDAGDAPGRRGV